MKVPRRKPLNARIGVMSIGLDTYWKQFDGLLDELLKKTEVFKKKVTALSAEVVDFGMIDNSQKAYAALPEILTADLDLLFVDMVTYGTSGTFGIIVKSVSCMPFYQFPLNSKALLQFQHNLQCMVTSPPSTSTSTMF